MDEPHFKIPDDPWQGEWYAGETIELVGLFIPYERCAWMGIDYCFLLMIPKEVVDGYVNM